MTRILRIYKKRLKKKTQKNTNPPPQAKLEMTILMGKRRGTESRFY